MVINELRLLLYKSIDEKGLNDPDTINLSKELDKLIEEDMAKNNQIQKRI